MPLNRLILKLQLCVQKQIFVSKNVERRDLKLVSAVVFGGTVDRVVASDCRKDWFESSHGQSFAEHLILLHFMYPGRKDKTKEKEAVNGPLKKPFKAFQN